MQICLLKKCYFHLLISSSTFYKIMAESQNTNAVGPSRMSSARDSSIAGARSTLGGIFRGDVVLAAGIVAILIFMLIPIPTWLLDMGLSISILLSVFILMLVLSIQKPLEFSTFPTVLLITTSLRLGLNVASTRLILGEGHEGKQAAGAVIEAFGGLIIQGSYVVGGIVFAIARQLQLPIRYIGVGEQVDDLRSFDARTFVDALFDESPDK